MSRKEPFCKRKCERPDGAAKSQEVLREREEFAIKLRNQQRKHLLVQRRTRLVLEQSHSLTATSAQMSAGVFPPLVRSY